MGLEGWGGVRQDGVGSGWDWRGGVGIGQDGVGSGWDGRGGVG